MRKHVFGLSFIALFGAITTSLLLSNNENAKPILNAVKIEETSNFIFQKEQNKVSSFYINERIEAENG